MYKGTDIIFVQGPYLLFMFLPLAMYNLEMREKRLEAMSAFPFAQYY
jgi:hypothetical protein